MKVGIDWDEWYPMYSICKKGRKVFDLPVETVERWKRAFAEFDAVQEEMRKLVYPGTVRKAVKHE
jgi:hypothetical protein